MRRETRNRERETENWKRKIFYFLRLTSTLPLALTFLTLSLSYAQESKSIGTFMAVFGDVGIMHTQGKEKKNVKLRDDVFFRDLIETLEKSKAKVLFMDDTILNIGEKTKIEITEHIFDPEKDKRSTVINLIDGKVRALVGRLFSGADSKFEVHTPTAVAAARGSYGIVWVQEVEGKLQTGVLNLKGSWEVRSIDPAIAGSIILKEGEFSQITFGLPPVLSPESKQELIAATEVKNQHKEEAPKKEEIAGRDISGEKFTPISAIIPTATTTTTIKPQATGESNGTESTTSQETSHEITQETTTPIIPPIVNQPPPTTPVHIEIVF